ncbi:MAG: DNA repair protein RadC, partial [Bacteroidales bacterium]
MDKKEKLNITDWALEDRPREKMLAKGIRTLSDAELIAILIGSGNKNETAVELSKKILCSVSGKLNELSKVTVQELKSNFLGIGDAKAISIIAALELGRRRKGEEVREPQKITSSKDAYSMIYAHLADLQQEEFWVILLNNSNSVIDSFRVSQGATNATLVDVKLIMKPALAKLARAIMLCHNHPSGTMTPSEADVTLTKKIKSAASLFDIKLLDHIIIGGKGYYSFADEG